jgi:hypothetical protein
LAILFFSLSVFLGCGGAKGIEGRRDLPCREAIIGTWKMVVTGVVGGKIYDPLPPGSTEENSFNAKPPEITISFQPNGVFFQTVDGVRVVYGHWSPASESEMEIVLDLSNLQNDKEDPFPFSSTQVTVRFLNPERTKADFEGRLYVLVSSDGF